MIAKSSPNGIKNIDELLEKLIRGNKNELDAYLTEVKVNEKLLDTETNVHCFMIGQDGNDVPKVEHLAYEIATRVLDYAIPRDYCIRIEPPLRSFEPPSATDRAGECGHESHPTN